MLLKQYFIFCNNLKHFLTSFNFIVLKLYYFQKKLEKVYTRTVDSGGGILSTLYLNKAHLIQSLHFGLGDIFVSLVTLSTKHLVYFQINK